MVGDRVTKYRHKPHGNNIEALRVGPRNSRAAGDRLRATGGRMSGVRVLLGCVMSADAESSSARRDLVLRLLGASPPVRAACALWSVGAGEGGRDPPPSA